MASQTEQIVIYIAGPALTFLGVMFGRRGQKAAAEKTISDAAQSAVVTMKSVLESQVAMDAAEVASLMKRITEAEETTRLARDHYVQCDKDLNLLKLKIAELDAVINELRRK